ncbi:MAG TPA: hypothetical protein VK760_06820 [Candidatus Acidoferrales bacterium]|jgi:hypothetical protein|nr:hypothetical protein [Candidatus Acidoferrales bacterium]
MDEKRFRFDLFIALCALLVSSVAAGASAYQTYVINQQYQASIWPYLGFSFSSGPKHVNITIKNYGLGPALIRDYEITKDGKPVPSFSDYVIPYELPHEGANMNSVTIGQGTIMPAGDSFSLVDVTVPDPPLKGSKSYEPDLTTRLLQHQRSLDVQICYCSLLGRCWTRDIKDPSDEPHDIRVCPLPKLPRRQMFGTP